MTSRVLHYLKRLVGWIPVGLRLLLGFLLIISGWTWLQRPDAAGYLTNTLTDVLGRGHTISFYVPFLKSVVLPNAAVFAVLVSWGEFLSGVSLFLGIGSRVGAAVAAFLFVNYGLMGGSFSLAMHGVLIALLAVTVYWKAGRTLGLDRRLHEKWPRVKI